MADGQILAVLEDVEFVGRGDLQEGVQTRGIRVTAGSGEPVPEDRTAAAAQARIGGCSIAAAIQVDERLGSLADQLDQHRAIGRIQKGPCETVGAVGRMAKPCDLDFGRCAPVREPAADPGQMLQQGAAGVRQLGGAQGAQELLDLGTVVGCGFIQNLAHVTSYTRDVKPDATPNEDVPAGELAFNFRSARLCLAFAATVGERWRGNYERLRHPDDLARWYREAGLLDETISVTATGLDAARTLREAVYRSAKAQIAGDDPSDADEALINLAAAAPPLIPVLRHRVRTLSAPQTDAQEAALSTVARDAIDLFTGPHAERIRECASPQCALLFVDTSRPGRRRWCSSQACGSKDRSAAYRRRQSGRHA